MSGGVLLTLVIILGVAVSALLFIRLFEKPKKLNQSVYRQYWKNRVMSCLSHPDKYALAIIEADKLMDKAFKERGFQGQTTGERLVTAGKFLSRKEDVWRAHKLRNRLVHEMDVKLDKRQTKKVLAIFVRALRDVGAI